MKDVHCRRQSPFVCKCIENIVELIQFRTSPSTILYSKINMRMVEFCVINANQKNEKFIICWLGKTVMDQMMPFILIFNRFTTL